MAMTIDGTNGLTFNNATVQNSGSKVLQVVNATYATQVTNATTTLADTGLTATITPLFNTSKILVIVNQQGVYSSSVQTGVLITLIRGSTNICQFSTTTSYINGGATSGCIGNASTNYLDSPATTSATTYKTQFSLFAGGTSVSVQNNSDRSTITLMEIAA